MNWKKKLGDVHYMNRYVTLCNIPMLGNNYAEKGMKVNCKKCLKKKKDESKL